VAAAVLVGWVAAPPAPAAEVDLPVASWEMDDGSRTLRDASGNGMHGTVGSAVTPGVSVGGAVGLGFPEWGNSSVNAQRLVVVGDDDRLDPGSGPVAHTVRFRTTMTDQNLVQKGQATAAGGMFKIETSNHRAFCVYRAPAGTVAVGSSVRVTDGRWHTVRCQRVGDEVAMWVDGVLSGRRTGTTGHIANSEPLTIGGKPNCNQRSVGCDYFGGTIDHVRISRPGTWVPDPAPAPAPAPAPVPPTAVEPGPVVK
jgi:hypothetical protein